MATCIIVVREGVDAGKDKLCGGAAPASRGRYAFLCDQHRLSVSDDKLTSARKRRTERQKLKA